MGVSPYFPLLVAVVIATAIGGAAAAASLLLGPRKDNAAKLDVYECGIPMVGTARQKVSVKFYITAILFILFDIETIFLFLWASSFDTFGWAGIGVVSVFLAVLIIGLVYEFRRGALKWD
jgi:NADH-quinone oxidoreductase subunit A